MVTAQSERIKLSTGWKDLRDMGWAFTYHHLTKRKTKHNSTNPSVVRGTFDGGEGGVLSETKGCPKERGPLLILSISRTVICISGT